MVELNDLRTEYMKAKINLENQQHPFENSQPSDYLTAIKLQWQQMEHNEIAKIV